MSSDGGSAFGRTDVLPEWTAVLAVVAHPDDESFGLGAIRDAFARSGAAVWVLQAVPTSVLWRRLEILGDSEYLRWLRHTDRPTLKGGNAAGMAVTGAKIPGPAVSGPRSVAARPIFPPKE